MTNVRSTQQQQWVLKANDEYLRMYDMRRLAEKGKKGNALARKKQMVRYNSFKEEVRLLALKERFTMPSGYFAIWFYIPHPLTWRKKKINEMLYKPHAATPDWDNLIKALFDGLMPKKNKRMGEKGGDDRRIHCGAAFKVWVKRNEGCIKILEYDKDEFINSFHHGHPSHP